MGSVKVGGASLDQGGAVGPLDAIVFGAIKNEQHGEHNYFQR